MHGGRGALRRLPVLCFFAHVYWSCFFLDAQTVNKRGQGPFRFSSCGMVNISQLYVQVAAPDERLAAIWRAFFRRGPIGERAEYFLLLSERS